MLREAQECYECSRENLKYKTSELDDAQNIIDSLQEKLANTANELASYKNGNIDHSKTTFVFNFKCCLIN